MKNWSDNPLIHAGGVVLTVAAFAWGVVLILAMSGSGYRSANWTAKQLAAHDAAETLRGAAVEEESEAIRALQSLWWDEEQSRQEAIPEGTPTIEPIILPGEPVPMERLTDPEDTEAPWETYERIHGYTIGEAGYYSMQAVLLGEVPYCTETDWYAETCILLNRLESGLCGESMTDVICQPGQYSRAYAVASPPAGIAPEIVAQIDRALTEAEREMPQNLWYAGQSATGSGVYLRTNGVTAGGYQWTHCYCLR